MPASLPAALAASLEELPAELQPAAGLWLAHLLERQPGAHVDAAVLRLVACSEYAARQLLGDWRWFEAARASGELDSPSLPCSGEIDGGEDESAFAAGLRRVRHRTLIALLWRELRGLAGLEDTLRGLSQLADTLVAAAWRFAASQVEARHGAVRDENGAAVPLVVVAMGKLGGHELNFSSDIDLVFLYPQGGDSDGERPLAAQEYFARQARRIVGLLDTVTADGFVFRVDTRLRPFGDSGPPVASYAAFESYLLQHGRSWERYAWIKARCVVPGAAHDAVRRLHAELVDPFVYRRYLDYGVFESLRDMKARVASEVERRDMVDNVKLGPGGIREIEFIVQSMQLVRGGSVRGLRTPRLADALRQLRETRGMPADAADRLAEAYRFLRRLENALQALRDQQVHDLPDDATDRARLALALGFEDWPALAAEIARHREFVSVQFAAVAFRDDAPANDDDFSFAVGRQADRDATQADWEAIFVRGGFAEATELAALLSRFFASRAIRQAGATARRRLNELMPSMLASLRGREHPARTLGRLLDLVGRIVPRSAYVALLNENPAVLRRLVDIGEKSAWLAEEVSRYPLLLDELLDPPQYAEAESGADLRDDLARRFAALADTDSERRVELLAQFQRAAVFRIAVADFIGNLPVMKVSDRLTELAEIVLEQALDIAWRDVAARLGEPHCIDGGEDVAAGMGVIAYGKLGGIELSYSSDLDLVFLHNSRGEEQQTNGARQVENGMFFVRLARRLTHFLTTQTASGALYEVDTRLRPSGQSGLLVTSVAAFERYQAENAWTWEHQALLRARPVAGHAGVARDFERVRADTLRLRVNRDRLRHDVLEMRARMRRELDRSDGEQLDLKQGQGGIGDIEFLVQYLVLANASRQPAVIHYPDNIRQLGTLGAAGCLPREDVSELQDIYRRYRTRLHALLLDGQPPLVAASEFAAERATVTALWQRLLECESP